MPCTSNDACSPDAPICEPTDERCVECLFGTHCDPGESCDANRCVPTKGCESNGDCASEAGKPVCAPGSSVCVACNRPEDCTGTADCVDHACVAYEACGSSLDCPEDQVCEPGLGRCFECVEASDCRDGKTCLGHACVERTACSSDKDCTPRGQLCERTVGLCVDCRGDGDCDALQHCAAGTCVTDVCQAGASECAGPRAILSCNAAGSAKTESAVCGERATCRGSAGQAACEPWVCTAGAVVCEGEERVECAADGLSVLQRTDCTESGLHCVDGQCQERRCEPSAVYCKGDTIMWCDPTGLSENVLQQCSPGYYCNPAGPDCVAQVCAPGTPLCDGDVATTCNAEGSGATPGGKRCSETEEICSEGQCMKCAPGGGPASDLRLSELFVGTEADWLELTNIGKCEVELGGLRVSVRTSAGSQQGVDFTLPSQRVAPGKSLRVGDLGSGADIEAAQNIFYLGVTSSDYVALCSGSCTSSTLLDLVAHTSKNTYGQRISMPAYPTGVTFSPGGVEGLTSSNQATHSLQRQALQGKAPALLASDWKVAELGGGTSPSCPPSKPTPGDPCLGFSLETCAYGNDNCLCYGTYWACGF